MPFNQEDQSFLAEIQQSAADFMTHTLETANSLYDKDTASYERLLALTKFCESWSLSVGKGPLDERKWDNNLNSDDEMFFDSTFPVPRRPAQEEDLRSDDDQSGSDAAEPAEPQEVGNDIEEQSDEFDAIVEDATEDDGFDVAPLQNVVEKLYVPEAILARQTQFLTRKKRGKFG